MLWAPFITGTFLCICVCLKDHGFATNPQTHKEGRCLRGYDDLQVSKKETKTSKTGCKMERKNARRSQGMHSRAGDCMSTTRASGFSSQKSLRVCKNRGRLMA